MIGDWVSFKECPNLTPYQVTKLDIKAAYPINIDRKADGEDTFLTEEDLQPIPLTPEILEKNGQYQCSYSCIGYGENLVYRFSNNYDYFNPKHYENFIYNTDLKSVLLEFNNSFKFKFVHELQHALRLVGLNELADNFKC